MFQSWCGAIISSVSNQPLRVDASYGLMGLMWVHGQTYSNLADATLTLCSIFMRPLFHLAKYLLASAALQVVESIKLQ